MASGLYLATKTPGGLSNLWSYWDQRTEEDCISWYHVAKREIEDMAQRNSIPATIATGIVALVSPGKRWENNISDAEQVILLHELGFDQSAFTGQIISRAIMGKGFRLLKLYDDTKDSSEGFVWGCVNALNPNGLKVPAFYQNLTYPGQTRYVTVDSHAACIWAGFQKSVSLKINPKLYVRIANDYRLLADHLDLSPDYVQGVCWNVHKRLFPDPRTPKVYRRSPK